MKGELKATAPGTAAYPYAWEPVFFNELTKSTETAKKNEIGEINGLISLFGAC